MPTPQEIDEALRRFEERNAPKDKPATENLLTKAQLLVQFEHSITKLERSLVDSRYQGDSVSVSKADLQKLISEATQMLTLAAEVLV